MTFCTLQLLYKYNLSLEDMILVLDWWITSTAVKMLLQLQIIRVNPIVTGHCSRIEEHIRSSVCTCSSPSPVGTWTLTSSWSSICCFSFSASWLCWLISSSCEVQRHKDPLTFTQGTVSITADGLCKVRDQSQMGNRLWKTDSLIMTEFINRNQNYVIQCRLLNCCSAMITVIVVVQRDADAVAPSDSHHFFF